MSQPFEALRPLLLHPPIAHRGLWTERGAPENSLPAFEAAREAGFGVELDVRLSADGAVVVFHDADLRRMTGEPGKLAETSLEQLTRRKLAGKNAGIPTLEQALEAIGPERLVLVECKTAFGDEGPLEAAVARVLAAHEGPAAVIGFNPMTHAWFAEHQPEIARGLNSYAYEDRAAAALSPAQREALAAFERVTVARSHFILPGLDILASAPVAKLRAEGLPVIAWTIRTPEQRAVAAVYADNFIFEADGLQ